MHKFQAMAFTSAMMVIALCLATAVVSAAEPRNEPAELTLTVVDSAGYQEILAQHRGSVIFVDFWASWCPPCMEQFPHTVEMQQHYANRGLVVIAVTMDETDEQEAVLEFLRENDAAIINLQSEFGSSDESFEEFEISNGALPHYKLYDRQGSLVKTFNSGDATGKPFTPEEVDVAVQELLAQPAGEP